MKKIRIPVAFALILVGCSLLAQSKHTVSGHIHCSETGEALLGATIYVTALGTGTVANHYGFYSLTLAPGTYILRYSYIGYETTTLEVDLSGNREINLELKPEAVAMEEVVVVSEAANKNVVEPEMGLVKLSVNQMKSIPVILGEQDILKTIQLLPGVTSGTEGSSGFYVRGGSQDQNLIILDEAPVYSAAHLLGFFSVFNSDAVKDIQLYKGNAPAEYGGRISSVLDIQMKEGNSKRFSASGGIGLLSSRISVEAPFVKDRGSFILSARRTYADLFLAISGDSLKKNTDLFFYDVNAKANYRINQNNRIFLSGYFGRDVFRFADQFNTDWGNKTGTLRWNHVFGNKLFLNSSLIFSNYNYGIGYNLSGSLMQIKSGIRDVNLKEDFQYFINTSHTLKFGANIIFHEFYPGSIESEDEELFNPIDHGKERAFEGAVYVSHKVDVSSRLKLTYGARYSRFTSVGPDTVNMYSESDVIISTETYGDWEKVQTYGSLEPRITFNYILNEQSSVKGSYSRNTQYVHLLSSSSAALPTDLWIPSSMQVKPQFADQFALGYFMNFSDNMYESSIEVYYKKLHNQIDYQNGASILLNSNVESQLVFGEGRSYGTELFVKKRTGDLTGWIGYTLSRTERSMKEIDNGSWYPARHDRTHDISVVAMYQLTDRWMLSANWVFNTGNAVTFPSGKYEIEGFTVPAFTSRNGYRMPNYHRLDVGATRTLKKRGRYESSLSFSIYNAYGRRNPYSITFRENPDDPSVTEAVRLTLFRWVPSVSYNFTF